MDDYAAVMNPQYEYPTSSTTVSGTSDLFSSTFAMLSDTAPAYVDHQWTPSADKIQNGYFYEMPQVTESYVPHIQSYDQNIDLRFDAYRNPLLQPYEPYNPVLTIQPQPLYLEQQHTIANQPPPQGVLQVATQLQQARQQLQVPTSAATSQASSESPVTLLTSQHRISVSNSSSNSPHNNNNRLSPHSESNTSAAEEILLSATDCELDDERVMCMACRGVYPSRRSLTGHIGRNEKCREIIGLSQPQQLAAPSRQWPPHEQSAAAQQHGAAAGRNYLEQLATTGTATSIPPPPGTESAKAGAIVNGQDGLSPICPYCDRFISHYKGNIRRHINQCGKTGGKRTKSAKSGQSQSGKRRKAVEVPEWEQHHQHALSQSINMHHMYENAHASNACLPSTISPHISPPPLPLPMSHSEIVQPPPIVNPAPVQLLTPKQEKNTPNSNSSTSNSNGSGSTNVSLTKKESDVPDDPYLCPYCDFLTVYKGNMKRHMNTCHINEPDCKDHKLDKMKASVLGVDPLTLMEKISAHKANSTRGRRPKKKAEQQNEGNLHLKYEVGAYQMSPPMTNPHMHNGHMDHMLKMNAYDDMGDYGCPADPYVYPPMQMMLPRPIPMHHDDPSDPLQATINHVAESHRL